MSICLIDTSIFVEILDIPSHNSRHAEILAQLKQKINENEDIFLPIATILETGNHIAQNGDGEIRRKKAKDFVTWVKKSINGQSPFSPIFNNAFANIEEWIDAFPNTAMRGETLGDLSIIHDWEIMCSWHKNRRVYIWSLDHHLSAYDRNPS